MERQNHWQLQQLPLVVEQQLIEHNMLDNTKQLHQIIDFVENQIVELLIEAEVVVLLGSKNKERHSLMKKLCTKKKNSPFVRFLTIVTIVE